MSSVFSARAAVLAAFVCVSGLIAAGPAVAQESKPADDDSEAFEFTDEPTPTTVLSNELFPNEDDADWRTPEEKAADARRRASDRFAPAADPGASDTGEDVDEDDVDEAEPIEVSRDPAVVPGAESTEPVLRCVYRPHPTRVRAIYEFLSEHAAAGVDVAIRPTGGASGSLRQVTRTTTQQIVAADGTRRQVARPITETVDEEGKTVTLELIVVAPPETQRAIGQFLKLCLSTEAAPAGAAVPSRGSPAPVQSYPDAFDALHSHGGPAEESTPDGFRKSAPEGFDSTDDFDMEDFDVDDVDNDFDSVNVKPAPFDEADPLRPVNRPTGDPFGFPTDFNDDFGAFAGDPDATGAPTDEASPDWDGFDDFGDPPADRQTRRPVPED